MLFTHYCTYLPHRGRRGRRFSLDAPFGEPWSHRVRRRSALPSVRWTGRLCLILLGALALGLGDGGRPMGWNVRVRSIELCSCKMLCPCWLGPEGEPDQGWCGGSFVFDIEEGAADGVELSGTKVVLFAEWPANFFLGDGKARL